MSDLVALATTIDVDGLKLGLGGNSHGGLELNAEITLLLLRSYYTAVLYFWYLLAGHNNFRGFDADSWHFMLFLRFDKS